MHQQLANYDPYTIQQVQFFVQKKNKYTTIKSILVSAAILALTIVLNISLVQQLWISRAELTVTSSQRKMSSDTFTSAYVCVIAKNSSVTLPNSTLYTFSESLNRTTNIIPTTDIFSQSTYILNKTLQRKFQCYDLSGVIINDDQYMQLNIYDIVDNFDFIFRYFTADQIMGKTTKQSNAYYQTIPNGRDYVYTYRIKKIHGLIYDSLLIDYQPEVIYGFSPVNVIGDGVTAQGYSSVKFISQSGKPFDTVTSYTITRSNIGEILGKLLSWFSIFVLIAAFGVRPILQYNYKVQLCKKLYQNPKLTRISISILSYLKYLVSFIKRDIFDEAILYRSFEQLQKDLDLLNLIKKQVMMKKLIKQNEYVNKQIDDSNGTVMIQNNEDDEKHAEDLFIGKFLHNQLLSQNGNNNNNIDQTNILTRSKHTLIQRTQHNHSTLTTTPDPLAQQNILISLFKSLDNSQSSISLISNKGQGYKTSWNTILTGICIGAVLWFIVFAGIFQMNSNYKITSIAVDYNTSVIANITINPEDILFRANKTSPTDDFVIYAAILDQLDNVVKNITLKTNTDCDTYKLNLNESTSDWFCLSQPIHLSNNGRGNKTKLGLKLVFNGFAFSFPNIQTLFWQYNIINNLLVKTKIYNSYPYSSSQVYKLDGQAIVYIDQNQQQTTPQNVNTTQVLNPNTLFWTCNKPSITTQANFKGVTYQVLPQLIKITKQQPTIWNVIDTAWGIVVLAFSVFLSKITRYLNIKERQKISKGQQNQSRNDIVSIVSTQYKLLFRVFGNELEQVKYFYKSNFNDYGNKIR